MNIFDELDLDPVTLPQIATVTGVDAALVEGGLAVIPSALLEHMEFISLALFASYGQRTVDTVLGANESAGSHVLVDRYYQQMWPASWSDSVGLYGASGVDLGTPDVDLPVTTIRVRHRRLPAYVVRTQRDLDKIALWWQSRIDDRGKVLYRGQNRLYGLTRTPAALQLLYGDKSATIVEPSLLTSARRAGLDGDRLLGLLQFELQDLIFDARQIAEQVPGIVATLSSELTTNLGPIDAAPGSDSWWRRPGAGALAREILALAQHYAIPSHGLDMSGSLEVATWFALHQAYETSGRALWYRPFEWGGERLEEWPCIYFATINSLDRERYELLEFKEIEALRPVRQEAFMLHGGWGWHSNLPAEHLVAVAYLHPTFKASRLPSVSHLFPTRDEDPFYDWLLKRRAKALARSDSPVRELYESMSLFLRP